MVLNKCRLFEVTTDNEQAAVVNNFCCSSLVNHHVDSNFLSLFMKLYFLDQKYCLVLWHS